MATRKKTRSQAYSIVHPFTSPFPDPIVSPILTGPAVTDKALDGQLWIQQTGSAITDAVYVLTGTYSGSSNWVSISGSTSITPATMTVSGAVTFSTATNLNGVLTTNNAGLVSAKNAALGYVLAGVGVGTTPLFAQLTSSDGTLSIDATVPGTIDIKVVGMGGDWTVVTTTPVPAMNVNQGYIVIPAAARVDLQLPASATVGSMIRVVLADATAARGWRITQAAGQQIFTGVSAWATDDYTTAGAGGYLQCINHSTAEIGCYAAVELLCVVADTTWMVTSSSGALDFV